MPSISSVRNLVSILIVLDSTNFFTTDCKMSYTIHPTFFLSLQNIYLIYKKMKKYIF